MGFPKVLKIILFTVINKVYFFYESMIGNCSFYIVQFLLVCKLKCYGYNVILC